MPSIEISRKDAPDALLPEGFTFALQARLENGQELIAHQHHGPIVIEFIENVDAAEAVVCVEDSRRTLMALGPRSTTCGVVRVADEARGFSLMRCALLRSEPVRCQAPASTSRGPRDRLDG